MVPMQGMSHLPWLRFPLPVPPPRSSSGVSEIIRFFDIAGLFLIAFDCRHCRSINLFQFKLFLAPPPFPTAADHPPPSMCLAFFVMTGMGREHLSSLDFGE